jgi:glycosyltransferase involved in cell wall biosynthesis
MKAGTEDISKLMNESNKSLDKFDSQLFLPQGAGRVSEGGLRKKGYFKKSYDNKPLISIITVVFNAKDYLEETILSVIKQSYDNVEYIIIDGGSSDGSFDIIKKYDDRIDYWVSEKDDGIYDAMNKGISLSCGDIIGIVNADDYYAKDTLSNVKKEFEQDIDVLYSDFNFLDNDKFLTKRANHNLLNITMSVFHPSVFIKKKIYKNYGYFDSSLKISADYKLLYYLYQRKLKFKKVDYLLTVMRVGGVSTKSMLAIDETFKIQKNNSLLLAYFLKYLRLLKRFIR